MMKDVQSFLAGLRAAAAAWPCPATPLEMLAGGMPCQAGFVICVTGVSGGFRARPRPGSDQR